MGLFNRKDKPIVVVVTAVVGVLVRLGSEEKSPTCASLGKRKTGGDAG
jgi:hypothetical protein